MLTTCLIVLIFGSQDFHHYRVKLCMRLQVRLLLRVLFLCYLVVLLVCFLYLIMILSQHYYFPNSLCLVPAHLNYVIKNLFDSCWVSLYSLLEGSAYRCVKGLPLSEGNYDTAFDLLKQRFGKKLRIICAHMDETVKLPKCVNDHHHGFA